MMPAPVQVARYLLAAGMSLLIGAVQPSDPKAAQQSEKPQSTTTAPGNLPQELDDRFKVPRFSLQEFMEGERYPVDIFFDLNSVTIAEDQLPALEEDVTIAKKSYVFKVALEGHADDDGGAEVNARLAAERVAAVERYFHQREVEAKITTESYGKERPLVEGQTEYARAQNRRVRVRILRSELLASTDTQTTGLHWMEDPVFTVVRVYFGTDRRWNGTAFEPKLAKDLTFGWGTVSIPRDHRIGEWEKPGRFSFRSASQSRDVVLLEIERMQEGAFIGEIQTRVRDASKLKPDRPDLLVFVHGYNVPFEDAVQRAAILAYDLKPAGPTVLYSWPSQGNLVGYPADEENNDDTVPHLVAFVRLLATRSGAKRIAIVAHSLGNRALLKALAEVQGNSQKPPQFANLSDVVLTAPDMSRNKFGQLIEAVTKLAGEVTLYASSKDRALRESHKWHKSELRVGERDSAGGSIVTGSGFTSVDVSAVSTDFLGHSYFADNISVITDLHELLLYETPAGRRTCLSPRRSQQPVWWIFDRCRAR
ncbi:MAG: hypothetical protein QOI58_3087 [Thermoanaerobaculia bacterium]|jgi:esterase/lipase superfamily enzyme/outer membrane protein OmpA-like peptidoglycan-associated protein|nr:hypothetical protein [Thermoanaerobaculia bacterium]